MPDTARRYGNGGEVTLAGVTWVISEWNYKETSENEKAPAAGDVATHRGHLRLDWQANIKGFLADGATFALPMLDSTSARITGTRVPMALKASAGDSNPIVETTVLACNTGMVTSAKITCPASGPVTIEATIDSCDGANLPTLNDSPA